MKLNLSLITVGIKFRMTVAIIITLRQFQSIAAALLLLFVAHSAHALDPNQPFSSYIQTRFTDVEGLSSNIVSGIVQSPDGFLWIRYGSGALDRFDGQHFSMRANGKIMALTLAPDGDLWLASDALLRVPATTFHRFGPLESISHPVGLSADERMVALHFSRSGTLWIGTTAGLYRFEHGVFSNVIPQGLFERIEESSNGDLLLTSSKGFMVWNGSQVVPHPELATQLGVNGNDIHHVLEDSRGVTWIATTLGLARRVGDSIEKLQPWGSKKHEATRVYEDPQGNVWISGEEGLSRATTEGVKLAVPHMKVRCMYGDRDGNLWVGTNGEGLYRFKDRSVRVFTTADGLPGNVPMTVLTRHDGTLWAGFNCGGLVHFDGHNIRTYNEKDGLLNSCVFSLAEDANNDLWVGTFGGGAFRFHDGSFTQYSKPQGLPVDVVFSVSSTRDGSMWFMTPKALSRLRDGQVRNYTAADGLSSSLTFGVRDDGRGGMWISTRKGLDHLEHDRFTRVPSIPENRVYFLGEGSSGALYMSMKERGVGRFENGQFTEILPQFEQNSMVKADNGDLWLGGITIVRVPAGGLEQRLRHDEPLDFETFGPADGMTSTQGSDGSPGSTITPDGKLWVATVEGLTMLDLPHLPRTDRKPVIYMKEFTVGRSAQLPSQELVLPAGTSHMELRFDAIEITSPEKIRMQYRMDGVDSEWLDVTPPGRAIYSTIPPGTHAFHVRACNRNGIWDRTGMVYLIIQKPFFYQTIWFRLALLATALLLVFGLYRLRLRQATARLNARFDERLAERTRIARELHDTLLQTIQGSKLVADEALDKPGDVGQLHGTIKRLSGWLGQATQEGRAALNSLRTATIETSDLAAGLRRATEECLLNNSMTVKFSVTGNTRELHPIARDEIYRIGYEAIRNACEHASASQLEICLSYARDLTLRVKDNGVGINTTILTEGKTGHFGLQGMRERATRIGSKLTLVSTPGAGTELTLVVPGAVIFRNPSITRVQKIKSFLQDRTKTSD